MASYSIYIIYPMINNQSAHTHTQTHIHNNLLPSSVCVCVCVCVRRSLNLPCSLFKKKKNNNKTFISFCTRIYTGH